MSLKLSTVIAAAFAAILLQVILPMALDLIVSACVFGAGWWVGRKRGA